MKEDVKKTEPLTEFPRNPERDENGQAVLYPGFPNYVGVAAIFGSKTLGEYVILAPSFEALRRHVVNLDLSDEIRRDRCRIATLAPMPDANTACPPTSRVN